MSAGNLGRLDLVLRIGKGCGLITTLHGSKAIKLVFKFMYWKMQEFRRQIWNTEMNYANSALHIQGLNIQETEILSINE